MYIKYCVTLCVRPVLLSLPSLRYREAQALWEANIWSAVWWSTGTEGCERVGDPREHVGSRSERDGNRWLAHQMIVTIPEWALFPSQVNASLVLLKFCGALRCPLKNTEKKKKSHSFTRSSRRKLEIEDQQRHSKRPNLDRAASPYRALLTAYQNYKVVLLKVQSLVSLSLFITYTSPW